MRPAVSKRGGEEERQRSEKNGTRVAAAHQEGLFEVSSRHGVDLKRVIRSEREEREERVAGKQGGEDEEGDLLFPGEVSVNLILFVVLVRGGGGFGRGEELKRRLEHRGEGVQLRGKGTI